MIKLAKIFNSMTYGQLVLIRVACFRASSQLELTKKEVFIKKRQEGFLESKDRDAAEPLERQQKSSVLLPILPPLSAFLCISFLSFGWFSFSLRICDNFLFSFILAVNTTS